MEANRIDGQSNENPSLCGPCGGKCCQAFPGIPLPDDFGHEAASVKAGLVRALGTGRWSFDYWEPEGWEDPVVYYPRPSIQGHEGAVVHASWGGPCALLNSEGCALPFDSRPFGCRDMLPVKPGFPKCVSQSGSSKRVEVMAWAPYQGVIREVIHQFGGAL